MSSSDDTIHENVNIIHGESLEQQEETDAQHQQWRHELCNLSAVAVVSLAEAELDVVDPAVLALKTVLWQPFVIGRLSQLVSTPFPQNEL